MGVEITRLQQGDRERWAELWRQYLDFYHTSLPPEQYALTWTRLLQGEAIRGFAARDGGAIVGLTHYLFHPSCWTAAPVCYLQDLFTDRPTAAAAPPAR